MYDAYIRKVLRQKTIRYIYVVQIVIDPKLLSTGKAAQRQRHYWQ